MLAAHVVHEAHVAEFAAVLYDVPATQAVHTLSAVAVQVVALYPAAQVVHAVHDPALVVVLNDVPAVQGVHTVSSAVVEQAVDL